MEQPEAQSPENQPHVLWKQLVGLVFWISLFTYFATGPIGVVVGLIFGGLTFADAWLAGIHKGWDRKSFLNISPMGWGIVVALLLIIAYPAYVLNRNRLKTAPGNDVLFGFVVVVGGILLAASLYSIYSVVAGGSGT